MKNKLTGKLLAAALVLLFSVVFVSQAMAAQLTAPAIVNAASVTIHTSPEAAATVTDVVGQNQVITLLGRNNDATWLYARTPNNVTGWVQPQGLTYTINLNDLPVVSPPGATATAVTPATATPVTPVSANGTVNTGALNIRSGPGVQHGVIAAVYFGDVVTLLGRNADATWLNIQTASNVRGWVNARYLTTGYPLGNLPVVDASSSTPTPGGPATAVPPVAPSVTPVPTLVPAPTTVPNTAIINTAHLNVRTGPGVGYTRVTNLDINQVVYLLGRNIGGSWVQISTGNDIQGWVNARYLTTSTNIGTLLTTAQSAVGTVATGNLNVRANPGATSSVVTVASYGSGLTLLGRSSDNSWLFVRAGDGKEGWSNIGYISTAVDVNLLPVLHGAVAGSQPGSPVAPAPQPVNPSNTASLRSCPNTTCSITGSVYSGLSVTATGRNADSTWLFVVLSNGQQGWIQASYVALSVPISTLPVVQ